MRQAFGFTLVGLLGLSVQIAACAQGSTLAPNNGDGGDATGGTGNGGAVNAGGGGSGGDGCTTEVCDGIDNNCDGMVDEGCECIPGQTASCYSGPAGTANVGTCMAGTHSCNANTNMFGPCTGEILPAMETCNGFDEDCNGVADDGLPDVVCGVGACMAIVPGCTGGATGVCVPGQPAPEVCDGIDNDCDQLTDESYPEKGLACDTGVPGVCAAGMSQCAMGVLTCTAMNVPSMETCDGLDNDCNGMIDDNILGLGSGCSTGQLGVCGAGTLACQGGVVDCFPNVPSSAEVCDGLDNNCDGAVDENNPGGGSACNTGQMGACAQGTQNCTGGMLVCNPSSQAQPETCNGIDDNCNGQADEGNPGGGQMCSCGGTSTCTAGAISCQGCTKEVNCNNGLNDDGDASADCLDTDCALGCAPTVAPCPAGQTLLVLKSTDAAKAIPDNGTTTSVIAFSETMAVKRVVMQLNITHTWDSDLWIKLTSPNNTTLTMSKSNGSLYENYTNTIFNSACATPITSGSAPFNGCYSPEQAMAGFNNQTVKGTWTLTVTDQSIYDTGTLNTWTLAMCVQ